MKEEFIKNSPLFAELTDSEQRLIGKRMRLENYNPGETLFITGGESDTLYLIKEGWVKLAANGQTTAVANLGPGSLLGEADFFAGRAHTLTANATGPITVWSLDNSALAEILAERPDIGLGLGLALGAGIMQYRPLLTQQLADAPLLKSLSDRERSLVVEQLAPQRHFANDTIYRSGDTPAGIFFVTRGTVRLLGESHDDDYSELGAGDGFGEMAVIAGKPHSNTAQAATETVVWRLGPADFTGICKNHPTIKTNLSRNLRASLTAADQVHAVSILKRIHLFADLPADALENVARLLLLRHVPSGELIFSHGDPGDAMYIVDSGSVEAISDNPDKPREVIAHFAEGDFFGETALLVGKTRSFSVYATRHTNLWCLYRTDFDHLLVKYPQLSVALSRALRDRLGSFGDYATEPHLKKIARLGGLSRNQLDELSARLQPRRYQAGSAIYHEGRLSNEMYFIERGQVEHWATSMRGPMLLETLEPGDFFGEIALLSGKGHPTTAYATTEADVWAITKADFDDYLNRYPNLALTLSRVLSERMEETMNRMRGSGPQRGLPAPGATYGQPPAYPAQPATPYPSASVALPPVPLRPVSPASSRPMRPVQALPPGAPPPFHSQYTQPMPPAPRPAPAPAMHAQFTQPVRPMPPSRPVAGPPASPPGERPRPSKPVKNAGQPKRKKRKSLVQPAAAAQPAQIAAVASPAPPQSESSQTKPERKPRAISNRKLNRDGRGLSVWFAQRSMGAKLRILAVLLIIIWLCGIMAPAWIIEALASTFEDNGALPGDNRSVVMQVREDGAVGAMAALPFVETATPTPTNTPTPEFTPTATATATRAFSPAPRAPTDTPTPEATPTPNVDFRMVSMRQLTACENMGKHHIFIKVQDPSGQGINGVPVKVQWSPTADGFVVAKTETKTDLKGSLDPGRIDFAMFKGTYEVQIQGGTSDIATGLTPDYGTGESCGENAVANSLYHISFEVIFQRTY